MIEVNSAVYSAFFYHGILERVGYCDVKTSLHFRKNWKRTIFTSDQRTRNQIAIFLIWIVRNLKISGQLQEIQKIRLGNFLQNLNFNSIFHW